MGWVQVNAFVKLPDRHRGDPDEHFAVFKITGDGAVSIAGYETTYEPGECGRLRLELEGARADIAHLERPHSSSGAP